MASEHYATQSKAVVSTFYKHKVHEHIFVPTVVVATAAAVAANMKNEKRVKRKYHREL